MATIINPSTITKVFDILSTLVNGNSTSVKPLITVSYKLVPIFSRKPPIVLICPSSGLQLLTTVIVSKYLLFKPCIELRIIHGRYNTAKPAPYVNALFHFLSNNQYIIIAPASTAPTLLK